MRRKKGCVSVKGPKHGSFACSTAALEGRDSCLTEGRIYHDHSRLDGSRQDRRRHLIDVKGRGLRGGGCVPRGP